MKAILRSSRLSAGPVAQNGEAVQRVSDWANMIGRYRAQSGEPATTGASADSGTECDLIRRETYGEVV